MSSANSRRWRAGAMPSFAICARAACGEPCEVAVDARRLEGRGHDVDRLVDVQHVGRGGAEGAPGRSRSRAAGSRSLRRPARARTRRHAPAPRRRTRTSTKSRGSKPLPTVILRMMSAIWNSTILAMPAAHSMSAHAEPRRQRADRRFRLGAVEAHLPAGETLGVDDSPAPDPRRSRSARCRRGHSTPDPAARPRFRGRRGWCGCARRCAPGCRRRRRSPGCRPWG